ncbi:MAG: type II secretion system protein [Candidatus Portnoybacteria bacterium]|nr:type II secretion system protein [Candidatus Portnoybacteria bacterium]MDD4982754.1 type II secretion system protein [Candidatus Portnoybacteria bacterium]
MKNLGFTLIELVVVIAIAVLLLGIVLPNFNFFQRQSALESAAQEAIGVLRLAQNKTLSSEGASSFGVYFESNKFTLFKGTTFYPSSPDNIVYNINSSLKISDVNLGGGNFLVFSRLSGETADYGSIKIEEANNSARNKIIFVDSSGNVSLGSSPPSDLSRKSDSRHTEFSFSQNTANATTLKLYWPGNDVTKNIDYQSYLNSDKTAFSWAETVSIGGSDQDLEIHTHSLTSSNTVFCVLRDHQDKYPGLNIYLDNQNLLNYSYTGTTTKGTSVWAENPTNL